MDQWWPAERIARADTPTSRSDTVRPTDARGPKVASVRSYSTRFQLNEDPISEGGKWINGAKDGIDWYNVIKGYVNGVEVISATDSTFNAGNPGMGFNFGVGESNGDFGFSNYKVDSDND
jgi:hypothetical protein